MDSDTIIVKHQSKRRPQFWFKAIFSLGIWLIWWKNNFLALTKRAVVRHTGVFNRQERAVPLNQIQDISIDYGVIRRLLGHGDVRIETAGSTAGTEIIMKYVDKPEEFRAMIFKQIDEFYGDDGQPEKPKAK